MNSKIKISPADKVFSQFVRTRDKRCLRCNSQVVFNAGGLPVTHQASHFYGRARKSTRFDPQNVDTLCYACHVFWGSTDRESYRQFKIRQLGLQGFDLLTLRANTIDKSIDERVITMYYKKELKKYAHL
jgi:hypothetical protein